MPDVEIDQKLTTKEMAAMAGIAQQTADLWRTQGKGPRFFKIGRNIRYSRREIERWLDSCTCSNTAQAAALAIA